MLKLKMNNRPLALEFVNANHTGQWWSDAMSEDDMNLYIENFIMNNWDEYKQFVLDKHTYGL